VGVDDLVLHRHGHLLIGVGVEQALDQQVPHEDAHEHAAVVAVLLLRGVFHLRKLEREAQDLAQSVGALLRLEEVGAAERVVVEGHAVNDRDEKERPVGAPVGAPTVPCVVDGEEDVSHLAEVRQGTADALEIDGLHEQEGYAWAQEDDPGPGILWENLPFEPSEESELVCNFKRGIWLD